MAQTQEISNNSPTCMTSVNRIVKLPVVESSIELAATVYGKVKDYNGLIHWSCSTAENVVYKAVEIGNPIVCPIVHGFDGPIKKVDDLLCTGIDYVEEKIPAVKLPTSELFCQGVIITTDYVNNNVTPAVTTVYSYVKPVVKKIEPLVETAKTVLEPAMIIVEPAVERAKILLEPAIEKAKSIVEPVVETIKQCNQRNQCSRGHPEGDVECEDCQAAAREMGHSQ